MDLESRIHEELAAACHLLEKLCGEATLWEVLLLLLWMSLCFLRRVIDEGLRIVGSTLVQSQHTEEEDFREHRDIGEEKRSNQSEEAKSGLSASTNQNAGEEISRNGSDHLEGGTRRRSSKLSSNLNIDFDWKVMNDQAQNLPEEQMRSEIRGVRKSELEHPSSLLPHLRDDFMGPRIWPKLPLNPWAIWQLSQVFRMVGQVVKVCSEADPHFNLAVRNDEIVVVKADDSDLYQQWIKDELWSSKVKESTGRPAFSLVNLGSGKALRHPPNAEEKVSQAVYHQDSPNGKVLWNSGDDVGRRWHAIHPISDIELCLDINHGATRYGHLTEGQEVILFPFNDQENQHWEISPISVSFHDHHSRY